MAYSKSDNGGATALAVARGRLDGDQLVEVEDVFVQNRYSSPGRHYGSRLAWLSDGTLLVSVGDRGPEPPRAQNTGDHAGTLLRLNDDGSVPGDNPFIDDEELLLGELGRIRDVREGPDGDIYVLTDHADGALYRIEPID